jgi:cysteine dioxygenase
VATRNQIVRNLNLIDSPVHDHANSHCFMKALKGSLLESVYETKNADDGLFELQVKSQSLLLPDQSAYISGSLALTR